MALDLVRLDKMTPRVGFGRSVSADAELAEAVGAARAAGYSWAGIAAMLGVSKQTAQVRYGG